MPIHESEESIEKRREEAKKKINYSENGLYLHIKSGKLYIVLGLVVEHETLEVKVRYRRWSEEFGIIEWVQAVEPFSEKFEVFRGFKHGQSRSKSEA